MAPASYIHAFDTTADQVAAILVRVLAKDVTLESDFFMLGGDSLAALELMVGIEIVYGLKVEPIEIFERPLVSEFASYIDQLLQEQA